ncbi:unnamed protein product [Cylicocyclus nassatus]|uniref:Uncharacterized protein n=1 Tax=Cylicocyclus nassatus TaxID=53992 RepID=A0AA36GKD5_CYLNA|nr:unnamed protein product [Cylicocyclus nassatus]
MMSAKSPESHSTSPASHSLGPPVLDGSVQMEATALSTIPSLNPFSLSLQSTQLEDPSFALTLEDMELIKQHLKSNGVFGESQEVSFKWLLDNITILHCLTPQSGNHLEHLIGKEFLYVRDALKALELLSQYGIITPDELTLSDDAKLLRESHQLDRLTFHSLANVVRNIIKDRPESKTSLRL